MLRRSTLASMLVAAVVVPLAPAMAAPAPSMSPPPSPASPPPSSQPVPPATMPARPNPQELHGQVMDAMRNGQLAVAFELMERAYEATPAAQRTRPLVLNRAILDLTQRVNVMRAVRDLQQYLRAEPQRQDEQAVNILGAALNVAADNPRWKGGTLWQSAFREWDRHNSRMNDLRPGFRRWGVQWLTEEQYQALQADRDGIDRAIAAQAERVERATTVAQTLKARHRMLVQTSRIQRQQMTGRGRVDDPNAPIGGPDSPLGLPDAAQSTATAWAAANDAAARAAADLQVAVSDHQAEAARLAELRRARASLRPMWPATFEPIPFDALTPPPPPPPDPQAMAAIVEQSAKEKRRMESPFSASGTAREAGNAPVAPAANVAAPTTAPAPQSPFGPRDVDKRAR